MAGHASLNMKNLLPAFAKLAVLVFAAATANAAMTVATVGDSLADAIYLGIKLQPQLLKSQDIRLTRWSRARIGLTRIDLFDYTAWLRDNNDLGAVDFCVVELGANDLQSIATGKLKWAFLGTQEWQRIYAGRVETMVSTLKTQRCKEVVWILQPAYERNKFLNGHHALINSTQLLGLKSGSAAAFEIVTDQNDYQRDGIHFNGPFALKLARAVVNLVESWKTFTTTGCAACHAAEGYHWIKPQELSPLKWQRP